MKFKLENFWELDTTQLLAVNGGSGCGSSSGGGSYSGSSSSGGGSSGGGGSSSGSSSSSSGGGSGGGSCGGASSSVASSNGGGSSSGGSGGGSCGGSTSAITTVVSSVKTGSSSGGGSCSKFDLSPYKQPNEGSWGGIEAGSANEKSNMQKHEKFSENAEMNGTSINNDGQEVGNLFSKVGCKMEGAAKISTEILGTNVDIRDVNNKYDVNKDGLLTQSEIASGIKAGLGKDKTLSTDSYYESTLNKATLDAISAQKEGTTYMLGRAEGVGGGQHWVVLEGYSINDHDQVQFKFNGTSRNDAGRTYILGKPESGQTNTYTISRIETYTVK